jgi:four helix bundle protein
MMPVSCYLKAESHPMRDFKKLLVWEKAHELTLAIYRAAETFPQNERYGLTGQMQRAAASIPANIAEGCGRDSDGDFKRFLDIAMGSASELQYHIILAHDLKLLSDEAFESLENHVIEVKRML